MGQEWKVSFTPEFENDLAALFPDKVDAERFREAMLAAIEAHLAEEGTVRQAVVHAYGSVPGQKRVLTRRQRIAIYWVALACAAAVIWARR